MSGAHDRRSFLGELLRGATRAAEHLQAFRQDAEEPEEAPFVDAPDLEQTPVPAAPAARLATVEELRALCRDLDREEWADEAASLARVSIRWTPGGDGRSRLGGSPSTRPAGTEGLALAAELLLGGLPASALPREGALLFFCDLRDAADDGPVACAVAHIGGRPAEPGEEPGPLPAVPVEPSAELTLPLEPASFEPDGWELAEWTELRERLAALQGTELEDAAADYHALHRLLGHPDTFVDHAELAGLDGDPSAWELLFQLSGDETLGVTFGSYARLFFWIPTADLRAGRFDRVRASVG